jgi:hypothetical protein
VRSLAVDGETFGHHHRGGDQALASVLARLRASPAIRVTSFAALLSERPPQDPVDLVAPTSWSCAHGVGRWQRACGCKITPEAPTQQDWRAPLRAAVDWLAGEVHRLYERHASWEARDAAGGAPSGNGGPVEMERGVLRAMTSCGWFFDDVAGLEGRQVLRYAAHAIALAGPDAARLEAGFLERLGDSRSNDPAAGTTADIYRAVSRR